MIRNSVSFPTLMKRRRSNPTTVESVGNDVLSMIFSFLDIVQLIRCSAVCKSWRVVINKLKLLQVQYHKQRNDESSTVLDSSDYSESLLNMQLVQLAVGQQRWALQKGRADVFLWKGHSMGFSKCRMKRGLALTGVGDKVIRLWSAESCKKLDEFFLPDRAPLIDFDFDEGKVVGVVGTRMCIWQRTGSRDIFSSREGLFARGSCMSYVDPNAVVGCEDGKVRIFDMYSRKISQIIKMHPGAVSSLSFTDEELLISGSSLGNISISDLSSDQQVATLDTTSSAGIKTLCWNPSSHLLFSGSSAGYASCWDLRTMRSIWNTRVSPNVLYSIHHLRDDRETLVVGGIDGVMRIINQHNGDILSRYIMEDDGSSSSNKNRSEGNKNTTVIKKKRARKLRDEDRIDLLPNRPPITCLAVGMKKIVTAHNDEYVRVWKFNSD